jgi:hypothetical protein
LAEAEAKKKLSERRLSKSLMWRKLEQRRAEVVLLKKRGLVPSVLEEKRRPVTELEKQRKERLWKMTLEMARANETLRKCVAKEIPGLGEGGGKEAISGAAARGDGTPGKEKSDREYEEEYEKLKAELSGRLSEGLLEPRFDWQEAMESGRRRMRREF